VSVPSASNSQDLSKRTIEDFGEQWTRFTTNDGFYASLELLRDICEPLVPLTAFRNLHVVEIGSGTGRIVQMALAAGAAHVTATEPSVAFDVLVRNLSDVKGRVDCVRVTGDRLPSGLAADLVMAIGVLHHIPDPAPVVDAAFRALRPGGRILVWLYGREGNTAYLSLIAPLRALTTRLRPGPTLVLAKVLSTLFTGYMAASRVIPLPLRGYIRHVIGKFTPERRVEVIYDQLKPAYAKYYARDEAHALIAAAGFTDVQLHHRHGYSWTVTGVRPPLTAQRTSP
jgi:SAM-dependent methyltransferase